MQILIIILKSSSLSIMESFHFNFESSAKIFHEISIKFNMSQNVKSSIYYLSYTNHYELILLDYQDFLPTEE